MNSYRITARLYWQEDIEVYFIYAESLVAAFNESQKIIDQEHYIGAFYALEGISIVKEA